MADQREEMNTVAGEPAADTKKSLSDILHKKEKEDVADSNKDIRSDLSGIARGKTKKESDEAGDQGDTSSGSRESVKEEVRDESPTTDGGTTHDGRADRDGSADDDTQEAQRPSTQSETSVDLQKQIAGFQQKLGVLQQKIQSFVEEGKLTPEEATGLDFETLEEEIRQEAPLIMKLSALWDQEIQNIKKYAPEKDLDKHVWAFQEQLKVLDQQARDQLLSVFEKQDDPIKATRQMLEKGKDYYDRVLSKVSPHGSLEKYIAHVEKHESKIKKELENLKSKLKDLESDGYTQESGYDLPESKSGNKDNIVSLDAVFQKARAGRI